MTTPAPPESGFGRELAALIACQVCIHACMSGTRLAAPLLALRLGHSPAAIGVLLALFSLAPVFLALPAGRYADRHGLRRPVGWGVLAGSVGAGLAVAWPVFPVLCVSALLTGGASGCAIIALQRHVGRAAAATGGPTELKKAFSWLAMGPAISNFIGPFCAGLVIDYAGFRAAFLMLAAFPVLAWWLVRIARELPPVERPVDAVPTRAWDLLRDPQFRRLMMVNWFTSSAWDVHTFVVPILGHERGLSASAIGTLLGAYAIAATLVRLAIPVIASRIREWAMLALSMCATAALFAIYPLMPNSVGMMLCSIGLGFALGLVQPMVMSMLHQITPEHRHGEALGMRMMVINAASVAMPMLFGAAGALVGVSAVFWAMSAVMGAGSRLAFQLKDDRKS